MIPTSKLRKLIEASGGEFQEERPASDIYEVSAFAPNGHHWQACGLADMVSVAEDGEKPESARQDLYDRVQMGTEICDSDCDHER